MKATRLCFFICLAMGLAVSLMVGCESGGDEADDSTPAPAPAAAANWAPYVGTWHGSGLREVWFSVSADDGTITIWDNVNPGPQSAPWNDGLYFTFQGGPTCNLTLNGPNSATVRYTTNVYDMTKL